MGARMKVELLDPRHDPEPGDWEELRRAAGQRVTWRWDLLRAYAWAAQAPVVLAVLRRDGRAAGAVAASLRAPRLGRGRYADPRRSAAGRYAGLRRSPAGIVDVHAPGNRSQKGWWWRDEHDPELLSAYLRAVRRALGPGWRSTVWREVSEGEDALLPGPLRLRIPTAPLARLALPWPRLDDWYAVLDPRRRDSLRRRAKTFAAELSVRVGPARDLVGADEAARLRAENDLKHRSRLSPAPPLPLPYLETLIGSGESVALTYRDGRRLLGLSLILDHPDWPVCLSWGAVPPEEGGRKHLYFDGYVRMIEWAIRSGRRGLVLGKGQAEVKRDLGAELRPSSALAVPL
ncbi:hypothetical protein AB0K40_35815 [Nonomuraea bangladeshensis]|uniref:GNAT family N-acetyltransferase n=1 Tax=Nonomuraea bangladeshensis TaxID=404385 RepID=A0ABV3HEE2_9ACTN